MEGRLTRSSLGSSADIWELAQTSSHRAVFLDERSSKDRTYMGGRAVVHIDFKKAKNYSNFPSHGLLYGPLSITSDRPRRNARENQAHYISTFARQMRRARV